MEVRCGEYFLVPDVYNPELCISHAVGSISVWDSSALRKIHAGRLWDSDKYVLDNTARKC